MKHPTLRTALTGLLVLCASFIFAQVTTATISGLVTDEQGEPLIGATVVAQHLPSGSFYGSSTRADGRYTIPNLRVGGPYTVEISYTGYKSQKSENIQLSVAQKLPLNFKLANANTTLGEVVVSGNANDVVNNQRTGAATNISSDQIRNLPTISRSAADYYRLTPQSDGNSFGGRNDQYNNFSLDGTIFNNPFGLDAATPGGQTDAQPVSLDAIDQIQVSLAPYDVTQAGFTGAAINAVTKSGTNEFKGTVFGFFRNQSMIGGKVDGTKSEVPELNQGQYGFSLGGPIVKNKVFFFANAEIERRQDLGTAGYVAGRPGLSGANVSRVLASDLELVSQVLREKYQYETGPYEDFKFKTFNNKALFKLDWNISQNHKLSVTGNWLDAFKEKPAHPSAIGRRGPDATTLQFRNSGYRINNVIYSGIAELKSVFGSRFSNKAQLGRTAFRDTRDPFSEPFPVININKDGSRYIVAGHEPFSINNRLNQDVWQINDQFNVYLKRHTLTAGFAFEKFLFDNSFNLNAFGGTFGPGFASVSAFVDSVRTGAFDDEVKAARDAYKTLEEKGQGVAGGWALAETNVGQVAFFLQDEIAVSDNLTVTVGLRADKALYFDTKTKIQENIDRNCCYIPTIEYFDETGAKTKLDHLQLPEAKILWSPRLGFNWDAKGDRTMQFRGGTGLFTGRFPFVWVGNQVANPNFFFYCTTASDFQFPQVWRTNVGYDQKFNGNWIFSTDLIYTKDINAMMTRNYGLNKPTGRLNAPGDNRVVYTAADRTAGFANNAYVFTNVNVGYTFNASFQLQRDWGQNFYTSLGYNYGVAKDASSIDAEISSDAYDRNPAYGNVNEAVLANSLYGNRHRIVGTVTKKFSYGKMATTVSAFFQYVQGGRYSYTYSGDLNNDGSGLNDLIYIPTDAQIDQMNFAGSDAAAQRTALKAYIAQDDYLSGHRGQVAEKYATLSPWYNNWDVRILQDLGIGNNKLQLSIDVLNIGNMLSSKWGVRQIPTNTQPIGIAGFNGDAPIYAFPTDLKTTFTPDPSFLSRWQAQIGLRYSF